MKKSNEMRTIRTKGGIKLGNRVAIGGKCAIVIKQGKKQETLLLEDVIECIAGKKVSRIAFR